MKQVFIMLCAFTVSVALMVTGFAIIDTTNTHIPTSNPADWIVWATGSLFTFTGVGILGICAIKSN